MKEKLFLGVVACAVALGIEAAQAQTMTPGKARVVRTQGHARFTTGNNVWQPVKVGDVYGGGTMIQTDQSKGSFVDLALGSGKTPVVSTAPVDNREFAPITANIASYQPRSEQNIVRIWENSALGIDSLNAMNTGADTVTDTQLDLRAGHIFGTVKKMSAGSKYEIKLPNGVAGIRGTTYDLWSTGLFRIGNGSGAISTVGANNEIDTKIVPSGSEFNPSTGQVNPLPQNIIQSMNQLEVDSRVVSAPQMVNFTADMTVYRVSPTHGNQNDQGQDNNNQ